MCQKGKRVQWRRGGRPHGAALFRQNEYQSSLSLMMPKTLNPFSRLMQKYCKVRQGASVTLAPTDGEY